MISAKNRQPPVRTRGQRLDPATASRLRRTLRAHPDWSNLRLAQACGVSDHTVERFRRILVAAGTIDDYSSSRVVRRFEPDLDFGIDWAGADTDEDEVPTVHVTIGLRFHVVEGRASSTYIPSTSQQFDDGIRDRGVEGLRDAVEKVWGKLLRDQQILDRWNRHQPGGRSR
jgi:hypothetical protein